MTVRRIFLENSSEAILYYQGRRLSMVLVITAMLHILILMTVDFEPIVRAIQQKMHQTQRAVYLSLEKSSQPKQANFINTFDTQGADLSELQSFPEPTELWPVPELQFTTMLTQKTLEQVIAIPTLHPAEHTTQQVYAVNRPKVEFTRKKIISAAAHQHEDAAYLYRWQQYIEAIGSERYPKEALQHNITGKLRLLVAINPDGTVREIVLRTSSGSPILDKAAIDIVQLAQPFEQLPSSMVGDHDVVEIIRTWDFRGKGIKIAQDKV